MLRLIILLLGLVAASPIASADAPKASNAATEKRGRAHFNRGKVLAKQGSYAAALVEYSKGYELTERPLFLFNMAECARALGDKTQARELYERYLAADASGSFTPAARARLAELGPSPATPAAPPPAPSEPASSPTIATPSEVAAMRPQPAETVTATAPQPAAEKRSNFKRNALLVGVGVAVVAGSVAI
jgi:tetratricopeptide (TPR) repeat protein